MSEKKSPKHTSVDIVLTIPRGLYELLEETCRFGVLGETPEEVAEFMLARGAHDMWRKTPAQT